VIGPVRARQGRRTVATEPIAVTVDSVAAGPAASLSPVARGLIAAAAPPAQSDRVALSVILPGDTALAGAQLDVVAAAWFPRELRTRLRRMPILTLQTPEGVWSYPGASPSAPAESRVGAPLEVSATVSGLGNVALWPEPVMRWPAGFRAYPGEATVRVEPRGGRMAGSKTFHYLVVPDSVGSFLLPEIRYAYYDFAAGDYTAARAPPRALAVAQGAEPRGLGDAAELAAELAQVLKVLGAEPSGSRRRLLVALCLGVLLGPRTVVAQGPSAEALYEVGALRAAADSFAARAAARPAVAAHWYNLGATLYRAGADGKAAAAWAMAARLTPRAPLVRRARQFLPPPDAASESLLATGVATPSEWALAAAAGWVALWLALLGRRQGGGIVVILLGLLTAACAGLAAREWRHQARPVAVVAGPGTAVRVAPYGGASAAITLDAGAALYIERRQG